ncbi:unnamed protein product, partial [Iphiclides podalirius]
MMVRYVITVSVYFRKLTTVRRNQRWRGLAKAVGTLARFYHPTCFGALPPARHQRPPKMTPLDPLIRSEQNAAQLAPIKPHESILGLMFMKSKRR